MDIGISNRYLEVGEIKAADFKSRELCYAEVWIGSTFDRGALREECRNVKRRPLESIAKEIMGLGGGKKLCPIFMCDSAETCRDTLDWGSTLFLLLRTIKERGMLAGAAIYTKCSYDRILSDRKNGKFRTASDDKAFDALFDLVDVIITEQANFYGNGGETVILNAENAEKWQWLIDVY